MHLSQQTSANMCGWVHQDMEQLEDQVAQLGDRRDALAAEVAAAAAGGDFEAVTAASQRLADLTEELRQKEDRWLELAERAE